jgi:hypothetical protein
LPNLPSLRKRAKTEQEQQALKDKENAKKELKEKRNELEEIWHRAIERVLQELSQKFQLSELITQHLNDVKELILVPHLLLHQIPFAALPVQHPEYATWVTSFSFATLLAAKSWSFANSVAK